VLGRLLALDFPGVIELRCQATSVRVVGKCSCGCATVDLEVDKEQCPPSNAGRPIPAEATVLDESGNPIGGVIVFLDEGYLSLLEIFSFVDKPIDVFPPLDRLRFDLIQRKP
jgi:hypothetical protein